VRFALSQAYFYRQKYWNALEESRHVAHHHAKSCLAEDALFLAGESHRRLNDPVQADKCFREVITRYPDTPAADDAEAALADLADLPEMFRRDDRRLDQLVTYHFPKLTPLEKVFQGGRSRVLKLV
jgi:Tetratricopeptide repeat